MGLKRVSKLGYGHLNPMEENFTFDNKGRSPSNGKLSDFSFYIDS